MSISIYALIIRYLMEHYIHYIMMWPHWNNVLTELAWGLE